MKSQIFRFELTFLALLMLSTVANGAPKSKTRDADSSYVITGYVFGHRAKLTTGMIKARKLTRINYAFGNIKQGKVVLQNAADGYNLRVLDSLRQLNPHLKILLSVGGWAWSNNFSDAVLTHASRLKFVRSAVNLVKKYNLDGIDIDWEYPGQIGDGNIFRPADKQHFTRMLKLLRKKFKRLQAKNQERDHYLITIAAGANHKYLVHTNMRRVQQYIDDVNLMTYDYYTGASDSTGFHTNLFASPLDVNRKSVANSVKEFIRAGVPADKIVIGAAFYGHGWSGVQPLDHGRYKPYAGPTHSYSFDTLQKKYINKKGYTRYWDSWAEAPYLWNAKSQTFITYDDLQSIAAKDNFIKKHNLAGIMFWRYRGNKDGILLHEMYQSLHYLKPKK